MNDWADPSFRLLDELILVVIHPQRPKLGLGKVPDLVALGRPLASEHVCLVITVEMNLVGLISQRFALQQLISDVGIAGGGDKGREPVKAGHNAIGDRARFHVAWPAYDRRDAEGSLRDLAFGSGKRRVAA